MRGAREDDRPRLSATSPPPTAAITAAAAGIVVLFLAHAAWLGVVVDDAFISFRYGRNLAFGHGWVWNVGEPAVEGFTSVLWVALCAAVTRLGLDVVRAAPAIGVAASLGTLAYAYRFARRRLGLSAGLALVPCLLLALAGPFATWAGSGMETNLFALLVLAAAYHATGRLDGARPLGVAALLVLATLTRPEGFGIFGLIALVLLLPRQIVGAGRAPDGRAFALLAATYLVPFVAICAWRYATFGDFVPNTFHAKTGLSPYIPLRGLVYTAYFVLFYVVPWAPLLWIARGRTPSPASADSSRFATATAAAIVLGYVAYVVLVGGDYMAMDRFFVPILPFVALAIGLAVARALAAGAGGRRGAIAAIAFGLAVTLVHSTPLDVAMFGHPHAQMGNYAGVANERGAVARFSAVGRFFRAYRRNPSELLATKVIGAIGWFGDLAVLDMLGLTDRHIARAGKGTKPLGLGFPGHERTDLAYVARRRPTYVMIEIDESRRKISYPDWGQPEANDILNREYAIREARIAVPGQGDFWLYFLERTDAPPRR